MVNAVDSFLNNAIDLYVQAVDYCRISTSQIPTPVGAGIQQIKPKSCDVRQMSPDFVVGATDRPKLRITGQNGMTPGIWPDPAVLAESPASWPGRPVSGQLAGIRPVCVGFWQSLPESCDNGRIPATLPEFVYDKF
jgi:hypothetical protein